MSDFEPIEIPINLTQNVETEGSKATKAIDDMAAASEKMRQQLESTINAQKSAIVQLTKELDNLKKLLESKTNTNDDKIISEKQQLADEVSRLKTELEKSQQALTDMENRQKTVTSTVVTGTEKMTDSLKEFSKEEEIAFQKQIIEGLKSQLSAAEKEFQKFNIGTNDPKTLEQREKLSKVVRELRSELKGEEAALEELGKTTVAVTTKSKSLETRIREVREAMAALKLEGKGNTEEYSKLEDQLGLLGTAYREVYNTQRELSSGSSQMEGILSGLSALSGLLSAGAGAFGLVNSESENFAKIQTKVQSLMAITIGLQQIQNTLHSTSAFRITTVTKAKELWTAATTRLSVALGISNVAAKALMATLTLGLTVAVTAVISLIDRFITKQKQAAEEQKKFNELMVESSADALVNYQKLRAEFQQLGKDIKAKERYVLDNKDAFEKLGIAINSVNDAERFFSQEGLSAFTAAMQARARATAYFQVASEKFKSYLSKSEEANQRELNPTRAEKRSGNTYVERDGQTVLRNAAAVKKAAEIWDEAGKDLNEFNKYLAENVKENNLSNQILSSAGIDKYDKNSEKAGDKIKTAGEKLSKLSYDIQAEIDAASVAAMKEGLVKKEAELKAQYDRQKATIEQKLKEVADLEKITGKPATEQRSLLKNWADAEKTKFDASVQQLRDAAATEIGEIWNEIDSRSKTRQEKELGDINKFYDQRKADLKKLYSDENKIAEASADIDKKRQNELDLVSKKYELDKLDFQNSIELKRQQIKDRTGLLETQKQENLLKIEKAGLEKRLEKLREMELLGGDVADAIDEVTVALEETNAELDKMPVRKLQEALSGIEKISGSLAGLGGTIGDVFSSVGSAVNNISVILDEDSGSWDKIGAGISSAVDLINMLTSAAANRKAVEKEYYQNQIALAHEYALSLNEQLRLQSELSGSGFVTDYSGKISDGFNALTDATSGYQEALGKLSEGRAKVDLRNAVDWGNVGKGAAAGAGVGAAVGSVIPVIGTAIGAVVGTLVGGIVGIFGGKKKKEMFGGLLEVFPELVDASGNLNKELAQTLISTNQVDDATKQLLQNALDWEDAVEAAREQIKSIVVDLAGDLGSSMKEAIVGAWEAGEDASKSMFNAASKSAEKFIEDLLYSTIFSDLFDQFSENLASSLDPVNGDGNVVDDYDWLVKEMDKRDEVYTGSLEAIRARAQQMGFDMWNDKEASSRQPSSKALASASQDSIDDLSGRITSVQGMVSDLRSNSAQSLDMERERRALSLIYQSQLATIADNTAYCRYLENMNRTLDDISIKGVKLKS
jgi:hypothetical protein